MTVSVMNQSLEGLIEEALSIQSSSNGPERTENVRFSTLVQKISHSISNGEYDKWLLSEEFVEQEVDKYIQNQKDSVSVSDVRKGIGQLVGDLRSQPIRSFEIAIPLNLRATSEDLLKNQYTIHGLTFNNIPRSDWKDRYLTTADNQANLGAIRRSFPGEYKVDYNSHWVTEVEAREPKFAKQEAETAVDVWLGLLNFALHGRSTHPSTAYTEAEVIRHPPFFIVVSEINDVSVFSGRGIGDITPVRKTHRNREHFDVLFPLLPHFNDSTKSIDTELIAAFESYHRAVTTKDTEQAFLHYWRVVEIATLKDAGEPAKNALERASAVAILDTTDLDEELLNGIADKRNKLVHRGRGVRISKTDLGAVKRLADSLLSFLVFVYGDFSRDDINDLYEYQRGNDGGFYDLLQGSRDELSDLVKQLQLFKRAQRTRKVRASSDWMMPADDWILSMLSNNSGLSESELPLRLVLPENYIFRRLRILRQKDLVLRKGGIYRTTQLGEKYLDGKSRLSSS